MDGACSAYGESGLYTGFWWGNLSGRDHFRNLDIDWRIVLKWIFRKWGLEGMDWIELALERDRWWALENAVMNLLVP
jgi:hypothetical protein